MRAYDIIMKKRDGGSLASDEIEFMVSGYVSHTVPDSQMAAWLMAIYFRGMSARETANLTISMAASGKTLDLSTIPGMKIDKHSTGGVGDKTTLVLIPLLAAAGIPMVKMAGRSLGFTGGTIDKLESIPGFRTSLSIDEAIMQVAEVGAAITSQTPDLAPADKLIYALRDLTATVESIPLIASSVMSKKIAAGADAIILDVKTGCGAFMKNADDAERLAELMVDIGGLAGKQTAALITDMNQPLGRAVGNSLEVKEAIETLQGNGPSDLVQLCEELGAAALILAGKSTCIAEGKHIIQSLIDTGGGADKLRELIRAQGGNPNVVSDTSILPAAPVMLNVISPTHGFINELNALMIAKAESVLGGSRSESNANPNLAVGIYLRRKHGEAVSSGEVLAQVHAANRESAEAASNIILAAYRIAKEKPIPAPLVYKRIGLNQ